MVGRHGVVPRRAAHRLITTGLRCAPPCRGEVVQCRRRHGGGGVEGERHHIGSDRLIGGKPALDGVSQFGGRDQTAGDLVIDDSLLTGHDRTPRRREVAGGWQRTAIEVDALVHLGRPSHGRRKCGVDDDPGPTSLSHSERATGEAGDGILDHGRLDVGGVGCVGCFAGMGHAAEGRKRTLPGGVSVTLRGGGSPTLSIRWARLRRSPQSASAVRRLRQQLSAVGGGETVHEGFQTFPLAIVELCESAVECGEFGIAWRSGGRGSCRRRGTVGIRCEACLRPTHSGGAPGSRLVWSSPQVVEGIGRPPEGGAEAGAGEVSVVGLGSTLDLAHRGSRDTGPLGKVLLGPTELKPTATDGVGCALVCRGSSRGAWVVCSTGGFRSTRWHAT